MNRYKITLFAFGCTLASIAPATFISYVQAEPSVQAILPAPSTVTVTPLPSS